MSVIYVKAATGRIVRTSLRGQVMPTDDFVPVVPDKLMNRAIANGDVIVRQNETQRKVKRTDPPAPPPVATPESE